LWDTASTFSNRRIDFVLARHIVGVRENQVELESPVVTSTGSGVYATDHRMIWSRVVGQ
jgi:hypothetical protein